MYSCSHRSGAAISGPGMQIGKRKPKKVSAANLLAERAALAGFTEVDTFTSAQQASAAHLPFENGTFDAVLSTDVLEHVAAAEVRVAVRGRA